ncbi:hypothetical protein [Arthrobacter sp. ES1]|uniref:hypothetical protein n=1 Tax=Arthrobacter sp. ES1 TaxID=1897056 RepID=UPI001CFFEBAA|nr:hypothetical protein [Arthrobacter sp. ES1]MCB5280485.1 hypothetical protein [Arthrobacter sp. ES1]
MSTNINIRITDTRPAPVRKRVSIPLSDLETHAWWEAQEDPSVSVRMLILDEIRANGPVDRVTRPRAQAPTIFSTGPAAPADLSGDQLRDISEELRAIHTTVAPFLPLFSIFANAKVS